MSRARTTCLRALAVAVGAAAALASPGLLAQASAGATPTAVVGGSRNVYAGGAQVRPPGPVQGDFVAAGGRVIVDQAVGGDATLAGGAIDVRAGVADDLRVMGGDVSVEGTVGGELFASGGNVTVGPGAVVTGSAALYAGTVAIQGRLEGALRASAQKVTIDGEVRGDVDLTAGEIELGPKARIGGALTYASESALKRAEGAIVAGPVTRKAGDGRHPRDPASAARRMGPVATIAGGVVSFLALLATGAALLLLLPLFAAQAPERIRTSPWLALAIGFGSLVAVPFLAVLLFVTLLGIPLGIALMALYPVLLLVGFVVGVLFVAHWLPALLRKPAPASFRASLGWFGGALLLVMLLGRVPVLGGVVWALVSLAGIGASVLELYGRRQAAARNIAFTA